MEAHKTIPWDSIPLIFAGFRLHNTITLRSFISSIGTKSTSPLTIVRGEDSPRNVNKSGYFIFRESNIGESGSLFVKTYF